jgi:drug/metabolite transporter (DMT)-like permease
MRKGVLSALLAAVAWGYVYASTQNIVERIRPMPLLASLYVSGAVLLAPFFWSGRAEIAAGVQSDPVGFLSLMAGVLIAEYAIIASVSVLGGTEAALLETSYPIWTAAFLYIMHNTRPSMSTIVGGALMLAGAGVIAFAERKS